MYLLEDAEQDICVQRALMGFIHDDCRIVVQVAFPKGLTQQNAISHVLDDSLAAGAVLKSDGVSHLQTVHQ